MVSCMMVTLLGLAALSVVLLISLVVLGSVTLNVIETTQNTYAFPSLAPLIESQASAMVLRLTGQGNCTELYQADFANGTYIVSQSGCYVLAENIEFNPAPWNDHRATFAPYNARDAFQLGFFAAILIEADDVALNLAGYTLNQSTAHALQQRFFSLIELSNSPFITGQGPVAFTTDEDFEAAQGVVVQNGHLGRSSHHGIHGNSNGNVVLQDLTLTDYEVAAIALNGAKDLVIRRVTCLGTFQQIPVLATYSAARFLLPVAETALGSSYTAVAHLRNLTAQVLSDVTATGHINASTHPEAHALFANPTGLIDGNAYGILLNVQGVAVNGFVCQRETLRETFHHIVVTQVTVRHTVTGLKEVVAMHHIADDKIQRGPRGELLRIQDIMCPENGTYCGNALSDVQILLGQRELGTLQIDPIVSAWQATPGFSLTPFIANGTFDFFRNGDAMFHVDKGAFGLRIAGGHHIFISDTTIQGVENRGTSGMIVPLSGETEEEAYYTNGSNGGHPGQVPNFGFMGGDARGLSIEASSKVQVSDVTVRDVHSHMFWAFGVDIFNDANAVILHDLFIQNISSFTDSSATVAAPKGPMAIGVHTTTAAEKPVVMGDLDIQDVVAGMVGVAARTLYEDSPIDECTADRNFYGL